LDNIVARASSLGLRVAYRNLGRRNGELTRGGLIVVNYSKPVVVQRCTIAHEMGHWHYGHDWTRDHDRARDERQADLYAAKLLISPLEYALAEQVVGPHPTPLARELGVTPQLVRVWQENMAGSVPVARSA